MAYYNPIVRTFCRIRAALMEAGVDRSRITPDALLEDLLQPNQRVTFRRALVTRGVATRRAAIGVAPTTVEALSPLLLLVILLCGVLMLVATVAGSPIIALLLFSLVISLLAVSVFRLTDEIRLPDSAFGAQAAIPESPEDGSIGELTLRLTRFGDHKASGYRFSRNEIAFKVKRIVSEQLGIPLEQITDDLEFADFD